MARHPQNRALEPDPRFLPFAWVYRGAVTLRNRLYDWKLLPSYRSCLPVICVGNATTGGTGKTPFVQFLAQRLKRQGYSPVILSRGYGGQFAGPHRVRVNDAPEEVGDEAVSHRQRLTGIAEVVIAAERAKGAQFIESEKIGDVIILDDGFQHRALARDLNVLLLDVTTPETIKKWNTGKVLPAGWLREPLSHAVNRADCLVFVSKGKFPVPSPVFQFGKPQFEFSFQPRAIRDVQGNVTLPLEVLRGKNIVAATGIGEPTSFLALLRQLGATIVHERIFPDHHPFQANELAELAPTESVPLIVTAKDAIKLKNFLTVPGRVYSLELAGGFNHLEHEQAFFRLLMEKLAVLPGGKTSP